MKLNLELNYKLIDVMQKFIYFLVLQFELGQINKYIINFQLKNLVKNDLIVFINIIHYIKLTIYY